MKTTATESVQLHAKAIVKRKLNRTISCSMRETQNELNIDRTRRKSIQIKYSFWIFNWIWDFVLTFSFPIVFVPLALHFRGAMKQKRIDIFAAHHLESGGIYCTTHSNINMMMFSTLVLVKVVMAWTNEHGWQWRFSRTIYISCFASKILLKWLFVCHDTHGKEQDDVIWMRSW